MRPSFLFHKGPCGDRTPPLAWSRSQRGHLASTGTRLYSSMVLNLELPLNTGCMPMCITTSWQCHLENPGSCKDHGWRRASHRSRGNGPLRQPMRNPGRRNVVALPREMVRRLLLSGTESVSPMHLLWKSTGPKSRCRRSIGNDARTAHVQQVDKSRNDVASHSNATHASTSTRLVGDSAEPGPDNSLGCRVASQPLAGGRWSRLFLLSKNLLQSDKLRSVCNIVLHFRGKESR